MEDDVRNNPYRTAKTSTDQLGTVSNTWTNHSRTILSRVPRCGGRNGISNPHGSLEVGGRLRADLRGSAVHDAVCSGRITLADAQHRIATDWYKLG
jgi:hypothetical protein